MSKSLKFLDISLLDEAVAPLSSVKPRPALGWVRAIREAFGMSRSQLALRIGSTQEAVSKLERNEALDAITLASLEKLAKGLGGRLVYAIVPPKGKTFEELINEQALAVARKRLSRVAHTMLLEDQAVEHRHQRRQVDRIVDSLLRGSRRALWR